MIDQDSIPSRKWTSRASSLRKIRRPFPAVGDNAPDDIADVYNQAGDDYVSYADGDPSQLFAFDGPHAYADRQVWAILDSKLAALRASGATTVRLLDAGCGPGTWLRRLVIRAYALGFSRISARGFDIAEAQIERARAAAVDLSSLPGVALTFDVASLTDRLPESDFSVDITLCLYCALSHLPVEKLTDISREIARVTCGYFITTVRPTGSTPTALFSFVENVRHVRHDHVKDRCEIDLSDGRHISFGFHLFTAAELRNQFVRYLDIEDLRGLDLFHSRFRPDSRWNPAAQVDDVQLADELDRLESAYATSSKFIDHATHLLLVARGRPAAGSASSKGV
jgi:SAM-dependent methyltransferase